MHPGIMLGCYIGYIGLNNYIEDSNSTLIFFKIETTSMPVQPASEASINSLGLGPELFPPTSGKSVHYHMMSANHSIEFHFTFSRGFYLMFHLYHF